MNVQKNIRQSFKEIVDARNKHKEKALAIKDIFEEQKNKISLLREDKYQLQDRLDQLEHNNKNQTELILKRTKETRELNRDVWNRKGWDHQRTKWSKWQSSIFQRNDHWFRGWNSTKGYQNFKSWSNFVWREKESLKKTLDSELKMDSKEELLAAKNRVAWKGVEEQEGKWNLWLG